MIEGIKAINARIDEIQKGFRDLGFGSPIDERVKTFASYMDEAKDEIGIKDVSANEGSEINDKRLDLTVNDDSYFTLDMIKENSAASDLGALSKAYEQYKKISNAFPTKYDEIIKDAARTYGVPEKLIKSVIKQESNFIPNAVSGKGAVGLMQIMPSTAELLNVPLENLTDPETNIMAGSKYLSEMLGRYDGRIDLALSAYNAGPKTVDNVMRVPNIAETKDYVKNIINYIR